MDEARCKCKDQVTLTVDQQRAYDIIVERLSANESQTVLTGYAGTGKSTVVARLILLQERQAVYVTAPTHKAAHVLRRITDRAITPQTVHSFLGLQLRPDGAGGYILQHDGRTEPPANGVVVVDEASMIGGDLWYHILAAGHLRWIFVGDPAQLPPVHEAPSPALSLPGAHLERIVRQEEGNPILRMAAAIREGRPYLRELGYADGRGVAVTSRASTMLKSAARAFAALDPARPPEVRVLAYRNVAVRRYNDALRKALLGDAARDRFVAGEWLMMVDTYFQDGRAVVHNSEELLVEDVSEGVLPSVGGLWKTHLVEAQVDGRAVTLPVLHEEEEARYAGTLKRLRQEALRGTRKWEDYYTLRESFPRLDHAYALTIHKSQGSTFETVYVDHRDAQRCAAAERRQLLYVAITRPSVRLALLV